MKSERKNLYWLARVYFLSTLALACQHSANQPLADDPILTNGPTAEQLSEPEVCAVCHPEHYKEWQTSMHAYAIADPIFQTLSKIGQEKTNHELDQFCLKCHTPLGSLLGETKAGFDFANLSPLAKAGVSCEVCHSLKSIRRGEGVTDFYADDIQRGPILNPVANSFHESDFRGVYKGSDFCSGCHQVKSPDFSFDLETTSDEWSKSSYVVPAIECQTCHMPAYTGKAAVDGPVREVIHRHTFIGVDYPLIDFPGKQETIERVKNLLENSATLTVQAPDEVSPQANFQVKVAIHNTFAGHNLPTGATFERQMWLEVRVTGENSKNAYFATGLLDQNGDLMNEHSEFVASGQISQDTSLVLYNGKAIDGNGDETLFFWEAKAIENNTIPALESRSAVFQIQAPTNMENLQLDVRLRFRSFPPYMLRAIGRENLIAELIAFDMETFQTVIAMRN